MAREATRRLRDDPITLSALAAIGVVGTALFLALVMAPLEGIDAIALWLFKAKLYFGLNHLDLTTIPQDRRRLLDYPPLLSMMAATLYTIRGAVDDHIGKANAAVFLVAATGVIWTMTASLLSRRWAAAVTLLLVCLPIFAPQLVISDEMGYADYQFAVLLLLVLACLVAAEQQPDRDLLAWAIFFATMAALTKNEGTLLLLVTSLVAGVQIVRRQRWPRPPVAGVLGVALAAIVGWRIYTAMHGYRPFIADPDPVRLITSGALPGRALVVAAWAVGSTSIRDDLGWLTIALILITELRLLGLNRLGGAARLVFAAQLLGYFLFYLFTPLDLAYHLSTSFDRLVLQLAPSVVLLLAVGLYPFYGVDVAVQGADTGARTDRQAERQADSAQ